MGFGFGDAVIVELLKNKNLLPNTASHQVEAVVFAQDEALYGRAVLTASALRKAGHVVDLVLDSKKKMKWVFQRADKLQAGLLVMHSSREEATQQAVIKNLKTGEQLVVELERLVETASHLMQGSQQEPAKDGDSNSSDTVKTS